MNERPTPETDAHIAECGYEYEGAGDMIDQAYARKMERERDEAREVAIGLAEQAERLRKERDDAWACCDELVVDSNAITLAKTVMRLESERDQAREERSAWISAADQMPDSETDVIAATEDGHVEAGYYDSQNWRLLTGHEILVPVTHWMPFPKHPEAEK